MDFSLLADQVTTFLVPVLPYLMKGGEKAFEEIGKNIGTAVVDQVKTLWGLLSSKVTAKPVLQEVISDIIESPDDQDARAGFRLQIRKLLMEDSVFAEEIERLIKSKIVQQVLAERGSSIRGIRQSATGQTDVEQTVTARDNSIVEDVQQTEQ